MIIYKCNQCGKEFDKTKNFASVNFYNNEEDRKELPPTLTEPEDNDYILCEKCSDKLRGKLQ